MSNADGSACGVQRSTLNLPRSTLNAQRSTPRAQRASGFTLIELMVVFALIALIVGLTPIMFDRLMDSVRYRDTVRAALTDLRSARQLAQTRGSQVRFAVDLQARTFGVDGGQTTRVPEPLEMRAVMAAQETGANGNNMSILFLPDGGASGGSLDLIRPSGQGVRLRVDWFTGRIEQEPVAQ
jgi:general secretion pathway protein H